MRSIQPSPLLRWALWADAITSGLLALLQLGDSMVLAEHLHVPRVLLVGSGIFLVGYVILLIVLARRERVLAALIGFVVLGNVAWAATCAALAAGWQLNPSTVGVAYLMLHVIGVLAFAAIEFIGLRRSPAVSDRVADAQRPLTVR